MDKRIIYKNNQGGVSIFTPVAQTGGLTIEEVAAKVVPTGRPFGIVDVADLPADRTDRDLWTVDETDLTDGVGA
ncbi:hypothetical protein [Pseudophaeobacter arcticus]|jgi:hypothetical protein|uniref:hypothetical protein n=1 Tax=Pseudophaeobacter arcticus TaxID=385492 RepID=UPI0039E231CD